MGGRRRRYRCGAGVLDDLLVVPRTCWKTCVWHICTGTFLRLRVSVPIACTLTRDLVVHDAFLAVLHDEMGQGGHGNMGFGGAFAVGLDEIVSLLSRDPNVSKYHLLENEKVNSSMKNFAGVLASTTQWPPFLQTPPGWFGQWASCERWSCVSPRSPLLFFRYVQLAGDGKAVRDMDPVLFVEWEAGWRAPVAQKPALSRTATLRKTQLGSTDTDSHWVDENLSSKFGRTSGDGCCSTCCAPIQDGEDVVSGACARLELTRSLTASWRSGSFFLVRLRHTDVATDSWLNISGCGGS